VSTVDPEKRALIEQELNRAADWLRYLPGNWLIYTSQPAKVWYQRLSQLPGMEARNMFICEVDLNNRSGFLRTSAWDWIRKDRS
jgi:hypothetical protein